MMQTPVPLTRDLVLIGGGHAQALVLRSWAMTPLPGARLTLISPAPAAPYTGMLPGFVAGHYAREDLDIDLVRLARAAGARLILDRAEGIDTTTQEIRLASGRRVAYDIASVDVGVTSAMADLPGFADHAVPVKPMEPFADRWTRFVAGGGGPAAVIGAGVGGAELAMAMAHALGPGKVTLVEAKRPLGELPDAARDKILRRIRARGVTLIEGTGVASVGGTALTLTDGREIPSHLTVGAAGARPWTWLADTGLAHERGYLKVNENLATSDPAIFAAGDCVHLSFDPRPKAGVYAVRAAPVLTANLRAALMGRALPARFDPQEDYLKLISLGRKSALAEKWGRSVAGPALWRLKNRIDRKFMAQFKGPIAMPGAGAEDTAAGARPEPGAVPPCAGCGGKVGSDVLTDAICTLPAITDPAILTGPGDDAAVLETGGVREVMTTDHLRAFTADPRLFARIAALHSMGDIWAMGARPRAALLAIILPYMSEALQRRTLGEIMAGISEALAPIPCPVIGGHTTQGAELTVGLTLTGIAEADPITLAGGRPGDVLILTRPIGAGVLLAAEMRGMAKGAHVAALLEEMARSQASAAGMLSGAHAMTDVTGFGLAGHLSALCRASGTGAELTLDAVPLYKGARDLARAGVRSTLFDANRRAAGDVSGKAGARADLLHDPQTAGGLLAAVDPDEAEGLLSSLIADGYTAAIIGHLTEGAGAEDPSILLR